MLVWNGRCASKHCYNIYSIAEGFVLADINEHPIESTHADDVSVNYFLSLAVSSSLF